nr:hypothetical protein [Arthrobacter sp. Bi26]
MIGLYWNIGRMIPDRQMNEPWGSGPLSVHKLFTDGPFRGPFCWPALRLGGSFACLGSNVAASSFMTGSTCNGMTEFTPWERQLQTLLVCSVAPGEKRQNVPIEACPKTFSAPCR